MSILNKILQEYPDDGYDKAKGFDEALVGVSSRNNLVYSIDKCVKILMDEGFSYEDALEHFYSEVDSVYFGKTAPIFIQTI